MRVCLLSVSAIADDSRVRRQGDAIAGAGHDVVAVGLAGARSSRPEWPIRELEHGGRSLRRAGTAFRALPAKISARAAVRAFWTSPLSRRMQHEAAASRAGLFVANDWKTLPIALAAAADTDARVHYDSHEFATEERLDSALWRAVFRPYVRAIEGSHIRRAATVSTVADGIAYAMQRLYELQQRPAVIRNVPGYRKLEHRPTGDPVTVLFHGALMSDRGLDVLIRSVGLWPEGYQLLIRGNGDPRYVEHLRQLAVNAGAAQRVSFEPAVAANSVVDAAHLCDVGVALFTGDVSSVQLGHALPNKLFEYITAGLALCVLDLPGMGGVVREHRLGWTFAEASPSALAGAIGSMSAASIDECKKHSLQAATVLNWERESERLLDLLQLR